jgi:cyclophilin family peptidyl-prolyl cis-trans isomerase
MKRLLFVLLALGLAMLNSAGAQDAKKVKVAMETSAGKIVIELNADKAPVTVKNFLAYVDAEHYDGTVFHRVIADFMIQGGGYEPGFKEKKTKDPIKNEAGNGLSNKRGTIAMARTNNPDSATAQFFINTVDNPRLDKNDRSAGYAVFGEVVQGMDVVDKIRRVETGDQGGHENVPTKDVVIKSVRRAK